MRSVDWRRLLIGVLVVGLNVIDVLGLAGVAHAQAQPPAVGASAQLHDVSGKLIATATFRELTDEVLINLTFPDRGALTGTRALQIHETGRCDPPDFASAGRIFNPFGKQHGLLNPDGPMAGDLPSLVIGPAGLGSYNTSATLVKLTAGPAALVRPGGTSLVILAQTDDDQSQPEGNAGARVACGVIVAGATAAGSFPLAAPAANAGGRPDLTAALLVGGLGMLLIGGGLVLRRRQSPRA
jgi:superoxide dismutase, Cu-Zn family